MQVADLLVFLTCYTLVVAFAAVAEALLRRQARFVMTAVIALAAVSATTIIGCFIEPPTTYWEILWFLISHRDLSALTSASFGVLAALVWVARLTATSDSSEDGHRAGLARRCLEQFLLAATICGVVLGGGMFIWKNLSGFTGELPTFVEGPGFTIETIADLDYHPLRLAVRDDGRVYVSYDYFEKYGAMGGAVIELTPDPAAKRYQQKIVVKARFLIRCYGLAIRDGDLFVSRSGFFPSASLGTVSYASTGAVTQLKDVNDDGYFEYAHDIVSGLPGVRGPDTMHQNNGIVFAPDGTLFVTTATDEDRALDKHPWAGAILRVSPDFANTEVYAKGFRNPWGIAIGPDDQLFVTDNDVDRNPGDEINHVVQGAHYGHPFVIPNEAGVEPSGFRDPIFLGGIESNLLGIVYATSPALPEAYRNCLYVTDLLENQVLRMTLERAGETYKVTGVYPFASVPSPVDLAVTPSGEFFVLSRRMKKVYRIQPGQVAVEENHE